MEFVGREPLEVFGTIHGPGYSGGGAFGNIYTFGVPVSDEYHTFAIEWQPDEIHWFVDGINYHNAAPADVAPNEWVYNHPFFLLLNLAVGGNFGGPVGEDTEFPLEMLVDYVRVFQAPNTSERFEARFTDDFSGWRQISIPFTDFSRNETQPDGAPNDGLDLTEIWGFGFRLPGGSSGTFYLDRVRLP
jgi:beta-glucanase (GH16 family)